MLLLEDDETVRSSRKISALEGNFSGPLGDSHQFGGGLASLGDLDLDGAPDVAVGTSGDDDGGTDRGAIWGLFLSDGPWLDLGEPLAGATGLPRFEGGGTLEGGEPMSLVLENAEPFQPVWLVWGISAAYLPVSGGVLVPSLGPPGGVVLLVTDGLGGLVINATWPLDVPSEFEVYLQMWIQDTGAPFGLAASNGLLGTTP